MNIDLQKVSKLAILPQLFILLAIILGFLEKPLHLDFEILFAIRTFFLGMGFGAMIMFALIVNPIKKAILAKEKEERLKNLQG